MDALTHLLDGPRGRGAILLHALLDPPWSLRLSNNAPIGLITALRGEAWLTAQDGQAVRLANGAVALAKGDSPVIIADDPATPPQVIVNPGWTCTTPAGDDLGDSMNLPGQAWGHRLEASTALLLACYQIRGEISQRVLASLPPMLLLQP